MEFGTERNRLALIAAWAAAIAEQDSEDGKPYKLIVTGDCYLRGGSRELRDFGPNPAVARKRTYTLVDRNDKPVYGQTVREINHVYGDNSMPVANAPFPMSVMSAHFDDNIYSKQVVRQDQQFVVGDIKLMIQEQDGTMYGTLGIYSDRNVVIINGNDGKTSSGQLKYCN